MNAYLFLDAFPSPSFPERLKNRKNDCILIKNIYTCSFLNTRIMILIQIFFLQELFIRIFFRVV